MVGGGYKYARQHMLVFGEQPIMDTKKPGAKPASSAKPGAKPGISSKPASKAGLGKK